MIEEGISIVIPTRDRGDLLLASVESALSPSRPPLEVLVVDDGSTDTSLDQVRSRFPQVRIIPGPFGSAARARNAGATEARGDILGFLDSDDVMLPAKTGALVDSLRAEPDVCLIHGATEVIDARGSVDSNLTKQHATFISLGEAVGLDFPGLASFCAMYTSATAIRRSAFDSIGGYDESLDAYEDWDLYLRLSLVGALRYSRAPAARYRVWAGNVPSADTAYWTARVAQKHLNHMPLLTREDDRRSRFALHKRIAESYNILGDRTRVRREIASAARTAPAHAARSVALLRLLLRTMIPVRLLDLRHRRR